MKIYYILLLYLLFLFIVQQSRIPFGKRSYILFAATAIFVISAFRDYSVGADTMTYKQMYYLSEQYVERYKVNTPNMTSEALFWITANWVRVTGASDRVYFVIASFIIILSFSVFIKRYSKSPFLSFWLYVTLGLFALSMSGLRQMLALSMILFSFKYLIEGKQIKYFFSIFIASFFHFSAIVMLPVYFLRKIKLSSSKRLLLLFSSVIGTFLVKDVVVKLIFSMDIGTRYSQYDARLGVIKTNPLVILVAIGIPFVSTMLYEKSKESNSKGISESYLFDIFYLISCINVAILIISMNIDIISRVGYYFFVCNLILLPNAIMSMKDQQLKIIIMISALVVSLAQFIISTPGSHSGIAPYLFFWQ